MHESAKHWLHAGDSWPGLKSCWDIMCERWSKAGDWRRGRGGGGK